MHFISHNNTIYINIFILRTTVQSNFLNVSEDLRTSHETNGEAV